MLLASRERCFSNEVLVLSLDQQVPNHFPGARTGSTESTINCRVLYFSPRPSFWMLPLSPQLLPLLMKSNLQAPAYVSAAFTRPYSFPAFEGVSKINV